MKKHIRTKQDAEMGTEMVAGKSIVDLILLDHKYLKDCIKVLKDDDGDKKEKLKMGKGFVDALEKHSEGEKKVLYKELLNVKKFRSMILEGFIEHGIVDQKVKMLKRKLAGIRTLNDELVAELKVLAEVVNHHVQEEESEMLPDVKSEIPTKTLELWGNRFAKIRKFTPEDLSDFPDFQKELLVWKDAVSEYSHNFVTKLDKYVESLKH